MANDESNPIEGILENIRGSEAKKAADYAHDQFYKGKGARRSLESEDGIDWDLVKGSDELTRLGRPI